MSMRVPGSITQRRFLTNFSASTERLNKLVQQNTDLRAFNRVSENTAAASNAFLVRWQLAKNEMYSSNLQSANNLLSSAETSATYVGNSIKSASSTLLKALNDPNSANRDVLAQQVESYRDEILKSMNNQYAGRYIFGGTSNSAPFTMDDATGMLKYNGEFVSESDITKYPQNNAVYVDIGLGMEFDGSGKLDPQTALKISTSGLEFLGYGVDGDGLENNVCDALTSIAKLLRAENFDSTEAQKYVDKLGQMHDRTLTAISDIGNRMDYIEYNIDRLKADTLTLQQTQNSLEKVNQAAAISALKVEETAYKTCLQIGPRLIQNSLFDYLR